MHIVFDMPRYYRTSMRLGKDYSVRHLELPLSLHEMVSEGPYQGLAADFQMSAMPQTEIRLMRGWYSLQAMNTARSATAN